MAHRKWFNREARDRTWDPWFAMHRLIPYITACLLLAYKRFCKKGIYKKHYFIFNIIG